MRSSSTNHITSSSTVLWVAQIGPAGHRHAPSFRLITMWTLFAWPNRAPRGALTGSLIMMHVVPPLVGCVEDSVVRSDPAAIIVAEAFCWLGGIAQTHMTQRAVVHLKIVVPAMCSFEQALSEAEPCSVSIATCLPFLFAWSRPRTASHILCSHFVYMQAQARTCLELREVSIGLQVRACKHGSL